MGTHHVNFGGKESLFSGLLWTDLTEFESLRQHHFNSLEMLGIPVLNAIPFFACNPAIRHFEKGDRIFREWYAARNQFAIMFSERFYA